MSNEWDGKVVMSAPGGPIVTMSLGDLLARKDAEIERLRAENELQRAEIELQRTSRHREARAFEAEHNRLQAALNTARRERDEARAEADRLREANKQLIGGIYITTRRGHEEREKLRADNARLRAQVSEYFSERETHPVEGT